MNFQIKWMKLVWLSFLLTSMPSTAAYAVEGIVALSQEEMDKKTQALSEKKPAYVDQLIAGESEADLAPDYLPVVVAEETTDGVRSWQMTAGFRELRDSDAFKEQRHELGLVGSFQTYEFGDVSLRAQFNQRNSERDTFTRQGGHFTIDQRDYAVSENWTLDNTLGINQLNHGKVTASSSHVSLPTRAFAGLSSRLRQDDTEWRLMLGETGDLNDVSDFERTGDKLVGLGVSHRFSESWDFGAQLWQTTPAEGEVKTREATIAARYQDEVGNVSIKTQVLVTDDSYGVWTDAKYKKERFRHQAGFYRLGDALSWMGKPIDSDARGAYWRMSYTHPKYHSYTSLDWSRRTTQDHAGFRHSLNYHWDRDTQVGGDVSFSWDKQNDRVLADEVKRTRLSAFVANDYGVHSNRLQLGIANSSSVTNNNEREYELDYSHHWQRAIDTFGAQLNVAQRSLSGDTTDNDNATRTLRAGLSWQRELSAETSVAMKVDWLQSRSGDSAASTATGYRLLLDHRLNKQWQLEGSIEHNIDNAAYLDDDTNIDASLDDDNENTTHDAALYVALRYQDTQGTPLNAANRRSGKIRGVVFFDENNDGVMQPLEKPAANMMVRLADSGLPVTTNRSGEFEFTQAPVGQQELVLAEENIPLPWGLADDARYSVSIALRQTQVINIPLVRLDAGG